MAVASSATRMRNWPVVFSAGILHLLLLSGPLLLVNDGSRIVTNPNILAFLFLVSVWYLTESLGSAGRERLPLESEGPPYLPLGIGLSLLIVFWVMLTEAAYSDSRPLGVATMIGAATMGVGIALRYLSFRVLGIWFLNEVAMLPGQPIIRQGIYRLLRHPSETGTLCLAFGGAFILGSRYGLAVALVPLCPCVILRTRREDEMLRKHNPVEFEHYARDVPAFVPGIRRIKRCN